MLQPGLSAAVSQCLHLAATWTHHFYPWQLGTRPAKQQIEALPSLQQGNSHVSCGLQVQDECDAHGA